MGPQNHDFQKSPNLQQKIQIQTNYAQFVKLPEITKKMLVHAHDVFLPYAQPQSKIKNHIYWTEQYLLYAYLLDNPKTRALTGSYLCHRQFPEISKELMGGKYADGGGSFWFELN